MCFFVYSFFSCPSGDDDGAFSKGLDQFHSMIEQHSRMLVYLKSESAGPMATQQERFVGCEWCCTCIYNCTDAAASLSRWPQVSLPRNTPLPAQAKHELRFALHTTWRHACMCLPMRADMLDSDARAVLCNTAALHLSHSVCWYIGSWSMRTSISCGLARAHD
jgi:hypothetical protein